MFDAADTVATAPRLTVVPEITAESVKAVKPPKSTPASEVIPML